MGDIHTATVARLVTDYFRTLIAEQNKGYELLLQANNYLNGPSGNNDIYKLMVERYHKQGEKFKAVLEDSKSIDQYLIRFDGYNYGTTFKMAHKQYVHLGAVEADEGKVVTGFQLYYKNNRLVVKIKQGTLREMGVIENNDWKSEDSYSWSSIHGENYIKYYDGEGTKKSDWEHTPKKWGDQAHEKVDYMSSLHISYVSKREVESNPVGMLTGVGLFWDTISCGSSCAKESKPLAIRANDYFEPEEKGEYCGKYSHYRMEEGEDINPACCGDYIYNKNTQVCNDQQIGPLFIDCGDAPTQYADKLECADGTFVDIFDEGWDGCLNKGSYRVRCPYPYIACEKMRVVNGVETKDFHCEITCSNHEGKRKTCNRDMKCIPEPRKDSKKLLCSDGKTATTWGGCYSRDSVRIQCKKNHYPCNKLRSLSNGQEFICSLDCSDKGGYRDCNMDDLVCIGTPRSDDTFLCSDGDTTDIWGGCYDRGSVVVQCPRGHYPCNNLRGGSNYQEFLCEPDCTNFGGYRDCFYQ